MFTLASLIFEYVLIRGVVEGDKARADAGQPDQKTSVGCMLFIGMIIDAIIVIVWLVTKAG